MISRRSLFRGFGALLAAPAVVKVTSLLPRLEAARIRSVNYLTLSQITRESVRMFVGTNTFLENINRQYAAQFGEENVKVGTQLRIRLPQDRQVSA